LTNYIHEVTIEMGHPIFYLCQYFTDNIDDFLDINKVIDEILEIGLYIHLNSGGDGFCEIFPDCTADERRIAEPKYYLSLREEYNEKIEPGERSTLQQILTSSAFHTVFLEAKSESFNKNMSLDYGNLIDLDEDECI